MHTIGYIRASTTEQEITCENQKAKIEAYAYSKGIEISEIITDRGESGKDLKRPGIQRLLDLVQNGKVNVVIIYKIDRMFRSTADALKTAEMFRKFGVTFHSITESIDTASPWGKFFYTLIAAFAELERNVIGERTKAALAHKKIKGEVYGTVPYGYKDDKGKIIINEEEQVRIGLIKAYYHKYKGYAKVCKILNITYIPTRGGGKWYPQQIKNIIKKEDK